MKTAIIKFVVLAALLTPALGLAQQPQRGEFGPGQMRQGTVDWLLAQEAQFRPTEEQAARLEEIRKQFATQTAKQREAMQKIREEARMGGGDRRAAFEQMRPHMEELRKADEQALKAALEVLTEEQRKVVQDLLEQRRAQLQNARPRQRMM